MSKKTAVVVIRRYVDADIHHHGLIEIQNHDFVDNLQRLMSNLANKDLRDAAEALDSEKTGLWPAEIYRNQVEIRTAEFGRKLIDDLINQCE